MQDMQDQHSRVTLPSVRYLAAQPEAAVLLVLGLQLRGHVDSLQHNNNNKSSPIISSIHKLRTDSKK
jgi:hypothetical protein